MTVLAARQRTPEWIEARYSGIGASEAAAAIGMSEWQSRVGLWAHKLRLTPPPIETMPMRLGVELEPLIARLYTEQTGVKVRRATQLRRHPRHSFMLASLDRRAGRKPIELKFSDRGRGYGAPGTDEVPDDVLAQVLHQLAVVDEPEGEVVLLRPSLDEVQIYVIRREESAEAALIEEESVFWDHVQSRTEPPLDGSEATRRAIAAIYPRDSGATIDADEELRAAMARLRDTERAEKELKAAKLGLRNLLTARMAEAAVLRAPGVGEVFWRRGEKTVSTTDWQAVAAAYRAAMQREYDALASSDLVETYLPTEPGWLDAIESLHTATETKQTERFGPHRWDQED